MKGIILAGGKGTRLYPITKAISKQLLPVYNKPMIYYPINTLISIGIKDILIITTPEDQIYFKNLLLRNDDFDINFYFKVQQKPNGIAQAFIIGEKFIENENVCLILGDNLFFDTKKINSHLNKSSKIFIKKVKNPSSYGVLKIEKDSSSLIHEKPKKFISNYAVLGIYMYRSTVVDIAKRLEPSSRNEYEITDLNNVYLKNNDCDVVKLEENSEWFDSGTFDSLLKASNFVKKKYE
tara:strand:- start:3089 stop:3799 length:711 start_codon:yes stop_codon:yes gene_type:complete